MKGKYIKHRPASTKTKGGNPSYFKPEHQQASPCINMAGEEIDSGNKYFDHNGKVRKKRQTNGTHYVRRMPKQVIRTMNDHIVYGTVSLLETGKGKQFWVARLEEAQWDSEQCITTEVLIGESISVEQMDGVEGCWLEVEHVDICDTVEAKPNGAINRMAGVFK